MAAMVAIVDIAHWAWEERFQVFLDSDSVKPITNWRTEHLGIGS